MTRSEFASELVRLQPALRLLTYRFTYDREESQDLVQDTLTRALTYHDRFRTDTNLQGWLFTLMRNIYINNYRKLLREKPLRDQRRELQFLNVEDHHTFFRPQENFEYEEIWRNVSEIPEDLQVPFKMHTTGYKYEEIAEHLGIPLGTVKNRIFQARKEIQKKLEGYR